MTEHQEKQETIDERVNQPMSGKGNPEPPSRISELEIRRGREKDAQQGN